MRSDNCLDGWFAEAIDERNFVLILQDQAWMPHSTELVEPLGPLTLGFILIRCLSHHKDFENVHFLLNLDLAHLLADLMCPSYS